MKANIYYIDLFCGAGGVTTGVVRAGGKVIACINHDPLAIQSHYSNHKNVLHFTEDIKDFNVHILARLVAAIRAHDPYAVIVLWASLECTHFSKAKGGGSRDADSRTLAEHLYSNPQKPDPRYIDLIDPDYIDIENVVEFMSWGPLRIKCAKSHLDRSDLAYKIVNGQIKYLWMPLDTKNGRDYVRWYQHICKTYGYEYDYRILNAADFGARTSRIRYFGQFKKPHLPFTWPEATHARNPLKSNGGIGRKFHKWKPVKPALDLEDKGKSIFGRKKPLSPNTLARIYAGLIKHVGEGKEPVWISKYLSNPKDSVSNPVDINDPAPTITTQNRLSIVQADFLVDFYGKGNPADMDKPIGAILTKDKYAKVSTEFLMKYFSGKPEGKVKTTSEPLGSITTFGGGAVVFLHQRNSGDPKSKVPSVDEPARTLTQTGGNLDVVFISKYYGGDQHHSKKLEDPADAILTKDHHSLVFLSKHAVAEGFISKYYGSNGGKSSNTSPFGNPIGTIAAADTMAVVWLDKQFQGKDNHQSIDQPAGSILTNDKHCKITAEAWLVNHNYENKGTGINQPAPTLLASRRHFYLVNPQYDSKGQSLENPCFTLIARMDKAPPSLVEAQSGQAVIIIYEDDPEILKKIKLFMAAYGIIDIKMRMLKVPELLRIQGFGDKYILQGNQSDQKRFIGNSVPPELVRKKVLARKRILSEYKQKVKAA